MHPFYKYNHNITNFALDELIFSDCNSIVDPSPFYQDCVFDLCACEHDPKDCLCPTLSFYAQTCSNKGIHIDWRQYVPECGINTRFKSFKA